jgi:hypothetical protein
MSPKIDMMKRVKKLKLLGASKQGGGRGLGLDLGAGT